MRSFPFTRPLSVKLDILAVGFVVATLQLIFGFKGVDLQSFRARVLGFHNPCIEQGAVLFEGFGMLRVFGKVTGLPDILGVEIEFLAGASG